MNYTTAREMIETGDLIAVKGRRGIFSILTYTITNSPYTHTATAIWIENGLWIAEINLSGNRLVPLSQITEPFDVYDCPVRDRENVRASILQRLRIRQKYGVGDLFLIALKELFGIRTNTTKYDICSEYCMKIYKDAGWITTLPKIPSPKDLVKTLGNIKIEVN
jgi:hypothetical protein